MAKARKALCEIIAPGSSGWERWQAPEGQPGKLVDATGAVEESWHFSKSAMKRVLVLPVSHVWVMPAWLKGDENVVRDMALLQLERFGIRVDEPARALDLVEVRTRDEARLVTMVALKDEPTPLAGGAVQPDLVQISAMVLPLAASGITVWRELGRLVVAITSKGRLIYASPLTAARFDERAIRELNNICLQLGFQKVLGRLEQLLLWLPEEEGDLAQIEQATGLPASREAMPPWLAPAEWKGGLEPLEVYLGRQREEARARRRVAALSAGLVVAAVVAVLMAVISLELREQSVLRERVAELTPKAARVLDQRKAWQEAAPAVDPSQGPLQLLLALQEPPSSTEVTLMEWEFTPQRLVLRGHAANASTALQFSQEVQQSELLAAFEWEAPPPELGTDEGATFELKGVKP